jgi:hypothetical protein
MDQCRYRFSHRGPYGKRKDGKEGGERYSANFILAVLKLVHWLRNHQTMAMYAVMTDLR